VRKTNANAGKLMRKSKCFPIIYIMFVLWTWYVRQPFRLHTWQQCRGSCRKSEALQLSAYFTIL